MQLIIFDMDGLMFDTEAVAFRAYQECGKEWGLATSFEIYLTLVGTDMRSICARYRQVYGEDMEAEVFYKKVGQRIQEILVGEGIPVKPGLMELLDAIDQKGIKKVIASSSSVDTIKRNLANAGIEGRFDDIISSDQVKRGKPFPDVFLTACQRSDIFPQDALVLEDSHMGIKAAVAGEIPVIGIPDLRPFDQETRESCLAVGETLMDVIPYL